MEVFNKIYSQVSSSVSSTVSQLSVVLPGNPVTREFDANEHIASAGPGLLWKIYRGIKKSTKQEASIFVLEKRQLDKYSKTDRDIILEALRRGVTQITKIRHPQVLTIQHPLEESRESLAFATEPVFASLANILGDHHNMPQAHALAEYKFYDIEVKYGLSQLGEGLAFLHGDMKLLHRNICPGTIIVNHQGAWKLFGFDFCVHNTSPANAPATYPIEDFVPSLPHVAQPCLEYLAPEIILSQNQSAASDMFSLGMLAFALYSPSHSCLMPVRDVQQFRARVTQLKSLPIAKLQPVPDAMKETVKQLLNVAPDVRPDAHAFIKINYFDDVGVRTLNYLDSLLQWDNLQKSRFYKGLPEPLAKLPQRVRLQRVFPCLIRDLVQPPMVPFVLPNILDIAQHCGDKEFVKYILPALKPVMKLTEPVQILLIFLQRMELLLKLTPADDVQQHVLPMLYRGLDSDTPQIHELCLSILPTFAGLLDHSNVKNNLLPRIKKLCLGTSNLSVRVNCLLCIGRLLEHLDKWLVIDDIIPFLPSIPSREPAVLMGILGIYKLTLNHKKLGISKEVMATKVLPFLMPLVIENGLNLAQFNALVALVKQMFQMVESEHRSKLEQLNSVQQERQALEASMPDVGTNLANSAAKSGQSNGHLDQALSGLGLDNFMLEKPKPQTPQDMFKTQTQITALDPVPSNEIKNKGSQRISSVKDLSKELPPVIPGSPGGSLSGSNSGDLRLKQQTQQGLPSSISFPSNFLSQQPQQQFQNQGLGGTFGQGMPNGGQNVNNTNNWNQQSIQMGQQNWNSMQMIGGPGPGPGNPWNSTSIAAKTGNWSALDNLLPTTGTGKASTTTVGSIGTVTNQIGQIGMNQMNNHGGSLGVSNGGNGIIGQTFAGGGGGGKTPMNQMMFNKSPALMPSVMNPNLGSNNSNASSTLSKDDIMDLLS